ncbi:hypothetical protein DRH27_00730 [Candidatus Falkowbacteria bacterium]|nr:MAG: hypothetical protein DRH27_00730 [Candidatus Falkowbacteria bacterium]
MKNSKTEKFKYLIIFIILFLFQISFVYADNLNNWQENLEDTAGFEGAGYKTEDVSFEVYVGVITRTALSLLGIVFILLMVYGGYLWMTDRGNNDQVDKAKKLITAAVIGLIIVVGAYVISYFVVEKLTTGTLSG